MNGNAWRAHRLASKAHFNVSYYIHLLFLAGLLTGCTSALGGDSATSQFHIQQAPRARLTYVALGASDTFGIGTNDPSTQSWPADLSEKLGNSVHLVNLGIPGIVAHEALTTELPVALDAHPDLITIWLAVNDLVADAPLDRYAQDMDTVLNRLHAALPRTRVVVVNVPDLTYLPRFRDADAQALHTKISAYNTIIADTVARHHVLLVDLYQQWRALADHPEYISRDGFHPNAEGYAQLAGIVYRTLQTRAT